MKNYRVYELAREVNMTNKSMLGILRHLEIPAGSHVSTIDVKDAQRVMTHLDLIKSKKVKKINVSNFRSLSDISIPSHNINILFGPNGSGKTSFLDAIWFVRDCTIRGVDQASSDRSHGIGILWDGAEEGSNISIEIETEMLSYKVALGFSSGRIEPFVGEILYSKKDDEILIDRKTGSDKVLSFSSINKKKKRITMKEPEKLALTLYVNSMEGSPIAKGIDNLLKSVRLYSSRSMDFHGLKKFGSESHYHTRLWDRCQNLWSVLRNVHDRRRMDDRYDLILEYMRESFPGFDDLYIQQTGPNSVYGSFVEKMLHHPVNASGVSDGHLQMLILLSALFAEEKDEYPVILYDEPEISLHPYALSVFAKAVKHAAGELNRQVFVATHSPVLLSQFDPENVFSAEKKDTGETIITPVGDIPDIRDLLDEYALGSLYMAEVIAAQSSSVRMQTNSASE